MSDEPTIEQYKQALETVVAQRDYYMKIQKIPSVEKAILKYVKKHGWPEMKENHFGIKEIKK